MTNTKDIGRIITVKEASIGILPGSTDVLYRLIKLEMEASQYLLSVSDSDEEAVMAVGRDEKRAENLFDAFVSGKVSPCTANDLLKDIILG